MSAEAVLDHLSNHRSVRRFRPDPVPDDLLDEILAAGLRASSSGNMQTWSVVVTRDPALRDALVAPHMGQTMVREAPALLTFCADVHRMRRWLALRDAPDANDDLMAFCVAAIDAVLASQNVALAAEARGLGICYLGSTLANCDAIARVLGLPWGVMPVVGFVAGVPDEEPPQRDRLPLRALVHHDRYRVPSDEEILETYRAREVAGWNRYMGNPELKRRVEDAGVRDLAELYAVLKYPKSDYAAFSRNVRATLARQGFLPGGGQPTEAGTLRRATPGDAHELSELAFRSKSALGYSDAFMEACRDELTLTPAAVGARPVYLLDRGGRTCGFYALEERSDGDAELDALFVDPASQGRGVGRALLAHARETAAAGGASRLVVQSDPHAEGFYRAAGGRLLGGRPSRSIPGRELKVFAFDLAPGSP